jgi:hypothetical protein
LVISVVFGAQNRLNTAANRSLRPLRTAGPIRAAAV